MYISCFMIIDYVVYTQSHTQQTHSHYIHSECHKSETVNSCCWDYNRSQGNIHPFSFLRLKTLQRKGVVCRC